ncbi:LysE family translocator [Agrobacterium tumefaciens]|uniref:LysE family translocator n=1 Tax=Agrobacterium tumefaciens TaxID=358 RepID=UPI00157353FD|nr:LysE family translocator [Agrobacterium tumefaciens]NSZ72103.1 LysE family translocator [Agrobacterium tumefaciens]
MAIDLHQIIVVYVAYVIAAGSPGPSNMRIMAMAMERGRRAGLFTSFGCVSGSIFWGMMTATGVSALLANYASALTVLKILGGLCLLYIAIKAARSAATPNAAMKTVVTEKASDTAYYRNGLLLHLSNPKSILAWIALVTLGLRPQSGAAQVAAILIGCFILSVCVFCGYALIFSTAPMVRLYQRSRRWIEGILAIFFAGAGIKLLTA